MESAFNLLEMGLKFYFSYWILSLGTTCAYILLTANRVKNSILSSM